MKRLSLFPILFFLLAGCEDDPPTTGNPVLTASFVVGGTQQAGQAVRFDASASTDPGGGGLSYGWSFGDGGHGGMREIAHFFAQAGAYPVRLTVRDAAGNTATAVRTVTIEAGAPPTGTAAVSGRVTLPDGTPLTGVSVTVVGAAGSVTSGADGSVALAAVPAGVPAVLRLALAGHVPGVVRLEMPSGTTSGYFRAVLVPRRAAVTLASAQAGGTASGADGVKVEFPAGAVVDAAGNPVAGSIEVSMTPIDLRTQAAAFPGEFAGVQADGQKMPIASLGVADVTLTQGGAPVQVAPGRTVTVEIPIYPSMGQTIPLWSLSEAAGTWVQEGTGTVVASAASPTGMALRGEVAHFTPWNVDVLMNSTTFVRPRCVQIVSGVTTPLAGPCWISLSMLSTATPVTVGGFSTAPPFTTTVRVWPSALVRVNGFASGDLYGQSAPVAVPLGTTLDVDVVLTLAPVGPVDVVAGGDGLSPLWASAGGSTWTPRPPPAGWTGTTTNGVASNGTLWVAASDASAPLASSPDGLAWTASASVPFTLGEAVAWNGMSWLAAGAVPGIGGAVSTTIAASTDGMQWSAVAAIPNFRPRALAWGGSQWVVVGRKADLQNLPVQDVIYTSPNGVSWTPRQSPFSSAGASSSATAVAWNGSLWVAGGVTAPGGATLAYSANGWAWTGAGAPLLEVHAVAWNGSYWVAGGYAPGGAIATSTNGMNWAVQSTPLTYVSGLAWTGTAWVAVGGVGAMTSANGINWTLAAPAFQAGTAVAARLPVYPPL